MSCSAPCGVPAPRPSIVRAEPPRAARTLMLTDLLWALAARRAAVAELRRIEARALLYSSTTAALFWPRPGAIRFDAPAAGNRPGRHGLWQRPLERRRLREAPLLLPWSEGGLAELEGLGPADTYDLCLPLTLPTVTLPVPIEPSSSPSSPGSYELAGAGARARHSGLRLCRQPGQEGSFRHPRRVGLGPPARRVLGACRRHRS